MTHDEARDVVARLAPLVLQFLKDTDVKAAA
jgi:hypothetical protein